MTRTAVVIATVGVIALAAAAPAGAKTLGPISGSITSGDAVQPGVLDDTGGASSCDPPKATPALASNDDVHRDVSSVAHDGPGTSCVTVAVDGSACGANSGVRMLAYQPDFDDDAIQTGYRGDSAVASAANPSRTFSFLATPGAILPVAHGAGTTGLCSSYSWTIRIAPNVDTDAATNVTKTSATLHGTVNEESEESTTHFEYGPTTSYGTQTTPSGLLGAADNTHKNIVRGIGGLTPNTVYHYRMVVDFPANGSFPGGTGVGDDQTFRTTADPAAATGAASSVTTTAATLNGTVNPGGVATTSAFEYGKTTSYGATTTAQPAGADFADHPASSDVSGLEPGTTYHFRAVVKQGGTVVNGEDATFTTAALPVEAPVVPPPGAGPGPAGFVPQLDTAAPSFAQGPRLSPSKFKAAMGTRVTYSLSEPATVAFTVERAAPGRKVNGRCVAPSRRNRSAKKCTRFVAVKGSLSHNGVAGANSLRFTNKKLKPGSYRLIASATDVAGNRSAPKRASFEVVR